jgi:hypothetical protein
VVVRLRPSGLGPPPRIIALHNVRAGALSPTLVTTADPASCLARYKFAATLQAQGCMPVLMHRDRIGTAPKPLSRSRTLPTSGSRPS